MIPRMITKLFPSFIPFFMMKKLFYTLVFAILSVFGLASCSEEAVDVDTVNKQTVFLFFPWTGNSSSEGLYDFLKHNLDSVSNGIIDKKGLNNTRVLFFLSKSATKSTLYDMQYDEASKTVSANVIREYDGAPYATAEGFASLLNDVKSNAEALNYALIIGAHGCGWTYAEDWTDYPRNAKPYTGAFGFDTQSHLDTQSLLPSASNFSGIQFGDDPNLPLTRFFGSVSSEEHAMDVSTLAEGIKLSGMKMQYILFDACYMCNVETAYELKDVTNYVLGSGSEILAIGVPYRSIWSYLNSATPNYSSVVSGIVNFYKNSKSPYSNFSAIDCRELGDLASIMKSINKEVTLDPSIRLDSIQSLDAFVPRLFYDINVYVDSLHPDAVLKDRFTSQLKKVVKAEAHTDSAITSLKLEGNLSSKYPIKTYCGLTISDPSQHPVAIRGREKTAWWKATHE